MKQSPCHSWAGRSQSLRFQKTSGPVSSKGHVGQAEFSLGCNVMVFRDTKLPGEEEAGCMRREKL